MKKRQAIAALSTAICLCFPLGAQTRTERLLEKNWKFTRDVENADETKFATPTYDDSKWSNVTVPHDWAIYGPFSSRNDAQNVAILQDGQTEAMEHAGRTGGLPFVGVGWYRTQVEIPEFDETKEATLIFDGAMSHAEVYINGKKACFWPNGYSTFYINATPYLRKGERNTIAVRLENMPESSRWYPGAGLYRNVHLVLTNKTHVSTWGTQITTPVIREDYAKVSVKTTVEAPDGTRPESLRIATEIIDTDGNIVATGSQTMSKFDSGTFEQLFVIEQPRLWSPDSPALYKACSKIYQDGQLQDEYTTRFGIRDIRIVPGKGFFLNGQLTKFKGVCMHHDLGPLGAAVNEAAIRRQIRILKDMGCNAIRTSHNMPAPELVRIADEMGMMLMPESFDEWRAAKLQNGYHKYFDEWAERDLTNLVRQFRNNPSVVMWCVGNEVPDQATSEGMKLARFLQDICHREDPTRPVTQGMDNPDAVTNNNTAAVMDVAGFNYRPFKYQQNYDKLPQQIILGSETASTLSSRGVYKFPVQRQAMKKYDDHQASSYDVEHCGWSNLPEDDFIWHDEKPYCIGEFVWTGFDYIGEPTPYYSDWPSHTSLFGIVDLAGIPKDRYYLYRSHWNKEAETLHILPHWNWKGREGETTPLFVYTNYPSAELFINGKSQGRRTKDMSINVENSADEASAQNLKRLGRYRLMWMDTKYEPGTVKVVAYDEQGHVAAEKEMRTAGKPHRIELLADRTAIAADGKDLAFVTVRVVDKDGNLCPDVQSLVKFKVKGKGFYRAGANGNPASLDLFHEPAMHLFNGMMTAVVQSTEQVGGIILEATAKGLKKGILTISTK